MRPRWGGKEQGSCPVLRKFQVSNLRKREEMVRAKNRGWGLENENLVDFRCSAA